MREIKFRAWNSIAKEMFNVDVLAISECSWDCPDNGTMGVSIPYQSSIKLMQYTGLRDKNEVEIYEGDLINVDNGIGYKAEVSFDNGAFHQTPLGAGFTSARLLHNSIYKSEDYEIIGNIFENPELLKGD